MNIYIYIYIYIYICVCVCVYMYIYTHSYIYVYMYKALHIFDIQQCYRNDISRPSLFSSCVHVLLLPVV